MLSLLTSLSLAVTTVAALQSNNAVVLSSASTNTTSVVVSGINFNSNAVTSAVLAPIYAPVLGNNNVLASLNTQGALTNDGSLVYTSSNGAGGATIIQRSLNNGLKTATVISTTAATTSSHYSYLQFAFYTNGPYASNDLASSIAGTIIPLAFHTNQVMAYNPSMCDLSTNQSVWTWPMNLTCLGIGTNSGGNYQATLVASNLIATQVHVGGMLGITLMFRDTNGVAYYSTVTNAIGISGDADIGQLNTPLPPSVVPASMLPPNWTNNISGHATYPIIAFWPHKNDAKVELEASVFGYQANLCNEISVYSNSVTMCSPFGRTGGYATSGDSSSPNFIAIGNTTILFSSNQSIHSGYQTNFEFNTGPLWSDGNVVAGLVANGLTNGMHFVDLSGYTTY